MVSTQVWLQADGDMPDEAMQALLVALDRERSSKVHEIKVDYDGISEAQVKALLPAITHNTIPYFEMAITQIGPALSASLMAAADANDKITYLWLLLGDEHFYYRGDVIEKDELLQIFHQKVTLSLESMSDEELTLLIKQLSDSQTSELSLTITQMESQIAQHVAEMLRKIPSIKKMSLSLGGQVSTVGQDIDDDFIMQFAALMEEGQKDFSEFATTASGYASSLLEQGKSWLNALTTPLAACMSVAPDLTEEEVAQRKIQEKKMLNKLA